MTTVTVTAEHIASGVPECEWGCPIALAIFDAIPGIDVVAVHGGDIGVDIKLHDGKVLGLNLPHEARRFITSFDDGSDLPGPFTFTLDYPAQVAA